MSTVESPAALSRSPFAVLREAEEAEEVLILTYTANLAFFERFALGETRALQARATVISDAAMVVGDPGMVRGAGVRYAEARAACPGGAAFHPKLAVIASKERATVCVGSGNLTLAGWHGNDEIWTILHSDEENGPSTLREVASFLRQLVDGPIRLSAEAAGALLNTAALLEQQPVTEAGPRVASTLEGPIIERIPPGPVDELLVYAPFHDRELAALEALWERLTPAKTVIYVQPQTSIDGAALQRWLSGRDAELRWCSDARYRHGKLIEWSRNGLRQALTGSPNLSRRALLRGIATEGGPVANCELAVISEINGSLAPTEAPQPASGLIALNFTSDPAEATRPGILVLGATLENGVELVVRLTSPLKAAARVQMYDLERDWTTAPGIPELEPGHDQYRLLVLGLPAGRAIRLLGAEGASNEVFIADPIRVRRRPHKRIGPDAKTPVDLLVDGDLEVLYTVADLLRAELLKQGAMIVGSTPQREDTSGGDSDASEGLKPAVGQTLSDYLDACASVLNEASVEWALALPRLPAIGLSSGAQGAQLTTETGDDAADAGRDDGEQPNVTLATALQRATKARRSQFRKLCLGVIDRLPGWPNLMRAYSARLVLCGAAVDLWPDAAERGSVLLHLVEALQAPGDEATSDERAALAAYTAIAVAMLRADVHKLSVLDEAALRFKHAAAVSRPALGQLDPHRIDALAEELRDTLVQLPTTEQILVIASEIQEPPSRIDAAIALLADDDNVAAHDENGTLVIDDPLPLVAEPRLLHIAGMVTGPGPVAVRGMTEKGVAIYCVWRDPSLVIARGTERGLSGRLYSIPHTDPRTLAAGWDSAVGVGENLPKPRDEWYVVEYTMR